MSDSKEKKSVSKKIQTIVVSLAVVAVAIGSVAYGIHFVMQNEGVYEVEEHRESKTSVAPFGAVALKDETPLKEYLADVLESVSDPLSAKVDVKKNFSVVSSSIYSDDEAFTKDIKAVSKNITDNITKTYFPEVKGKFGEPTSDKLPFFNLKDEDIRYAVITENVADSDEFCALLPDSVSVVSDEEYFKSDDKSGLVRQSAVDDFISKCESDENNFLYHVQLSVKGGKLDDIITGRISDTFRIDEKYGILQNVKNDIIGETGIVSDIVCNELVINAEINRFSDRIVQITYSGNYSVNSDLSFAGSLQKYGEKSISFDVDTQIIYTVTYAGLELNEDVLYVEKGDEKEISCVLNTEDDEENSVVYKWTSENPEIAEVTENGFVTGKKCSAQPVRMNGHAEYLGKGYDVSCLVYVILPVKNITLNEKELTLKTGENHQLTYVLDPVDATITDAYWFTTDENVASVDENGNVYAIGAGTATITAVSKNENFKSTCIITVE